MKQALKVVEQIKEQEWIIEHTNNQQAKRQRRKRIETLKKDLKEYCGYKNISYDSLWSHI